MSIDKIEYDFCNSDYNDSDIELITDGTSIKDYDYDDREKYVNVCDLIQTCISKICDFIINKSLDTNIFCNKIIQNKKYDKYNHTMYMV